MTFRYAFLLFGAEATIRGCTVDTSTIAVYNYNCDTEIWDCNFNNSDSLAVFNWGDTLEMHRSHIDGAFIGIKNTSSLVWLGDTYVTEDSLLGNSVSNCDSLYIENLAPSAGDDVWAQNVVWDDTTSPSAGMFSAPSAGEIYYEPWIGYAKRTDNQNNNTQLPSVSGFTDIVPNPFNSTVSIGFKLDEDSPVNLQVFSSEGRLITTLLRNEVSSGNHEIIWNGQDDSYNALPSGVYLLRLTVDSEIVDRKTVTLIR